MLSDEPPMEDEQLDQEEIWSAIRYLDPDERDKDREAKSATIIAVLAVLLTVCAVWVVLRLRVQGL
jgi:heme/copper-type cytochrome/quinol oxidase subunit 4